MPAKTKLGEQYVRFSVEGLKESEKATQQTAGKISSTWSGLASRVASSGARMRGAFASIGTGLSALPSKIMAVGASMAALGAPAAALFALGKSAISTSREGDQLAVSWQYLSRVVGDMFAPAVRVAALMLVKFADFLRALSPETKATIVTIGLIGIGLVAAGGAAVAFGAMFAGAMSLAGGAFALTSTLITVGLAALDLAFAVFGVTSAAAWLAAMGPVGWVIAGIALVGAAIVALGATFKIVSVSMEKGMTHSTKSWVGYLIQGIKVVTIAVIDMWNFIERYTRRINNLFAEAARGWETVMGETALTRQIKAQADFWNRNLGQIDRDAVARGFDSAEAWADRNLPSAKNLLEFMTRAAGIAVDLPGMLRNMFQGAGEMKLTPRMTVGFESLQGTFDRLQESFAKGPEADLLQQIRDENKLQNEKLDKIFGRLKDTFSVIGP